MARLMERVSIVIFKTDAPKRGGRKEMKILEIEKTGLFLAVESGIGVLLNKLRDGKRPWKESTPVLEEKFIPTCGCKGCTSQHQIVMPDWELPVGYENCRESVRKFFRTQLLGYLKEEEVKHLLYYNEDDTRFRLMWSERLGFENTPYGNFEYLIPVEEAKKIWEAFQVLSEINS